MIIADPDHKDEKDAALAAPKSNVKLVNNVPYWIADTGCGNDLISKGDANESGLELHLSKRWMNCITANGETRTNVTCPLRLK